MYCIVFFRRYLSYLPGDRFQVKFAASGMQEGVQYMREKVQKRLELEPSEDIHDYIDAYLLEKHKCEREGDTQTYSGTGLDCTRHWTGKCTSPAVCILQYNYESSVFFRDGRRSTCVSTL